jgi:hypothetical protein
MVKAWVTPWSHHGHIFKTEQHGDSMVTASAPHGHNFKTAQQGPTGLHCCSWLDLLQQQVRSRCATQLQAPCRLKSTHLQQTRFDHCSLLRQHRGTQFARSSGRLLSMFERSMHQRMYIRMLMGQCVDDPTVFRIMRGACCHGCE